MRLFWATTSPPTGRAGWQALRAGSSRATAAPSAAADRRPAADPHNLTWGGWSELERREAARKAGHRQLPIQDLRGEPGEGFTTASGWSDLRMGIPRTATRACRRLTGRRTVRRKKLPCRRGAGGVMDEVEVQATFRIRARILREQPNAAAAPKIGRGAGTCSSFTP